MNSYQDLIVWQKSMGLAKLIYKATANFPVSEQYGMTSQMRRASVSIPSNIAEGYSRGSTKEYIQFINISLGSASELETQLILAKSIGYLEDTSTAESLLVEVKKMLVALNQNLRNK